MKLPIGIDDFEQMIKGQYVYMDKTAFIEQICTSGAKVQLITRPRRFGKTLNMSMLYHFFDIRNDNRALFQGLAIESKPCFEECHSHPTLFLSFKDLNASDYETFLSHYRNMMSTLYDQNRDIMVHLSPAQQRDYQNTIDKQGNVADLMSALAAMTRALKTAYKKDVILLIDEYDSPVHEAFRHGFSQDIINFLRRTLGEALKSNTAIHKSILTGILRISKESIFSDLNNIDTVTVLDIPYCDQFGFTQGEVTTLLEMAGRKDQETDVQTWYNGYKIGNAIMVNPWSLLQYLNNPQSLLQPYWVNTGSDTLIREILLHCDPKTQAQISQLISGESIKSSILAQANFRNLKSRSLWSLLLYSGYLTAVGMEMVQDRLIYELKIPNTEVSRLFHDIFLDWFNEQLGEDETQNMLLALVRGDFETFGTMLKQLVLATLSYYDTANDPERVYHAFVLGLLVHLKYRYHIRSNRESGYGRYDLMMIPKSQADPGIIIEFKTAARQEDLEPSLERALEQISERHYKTELEDQGIAAHIEVAIAFCGKDVAIKGRTHNL